MFSVHDTNSEWCSEPVVFLLGCRGQDAVEQPEGEMVHIEGGMVTLNCGYKTTRSTQDLYWYIQRPKDFPKFILKRDSYGIGENGTEFNERFHSNLNVTSSSVPLIIQNLQVSDSAVYYCALRPTVTVADHTVIQKHTPLFISVTSYCHTFCDAISVIN